MDWFSKQLSKINKSLENGEYPFLEAFMRASVLPEVNVGDYYKIKPLLRKVNKNLEQAGQNSGMPILHFAPSRFNGKKDRSIRLALRGPFNKEETYKRLIEELGRWRVTNPDSVAGVVEFYPYALSVLGNVSRIYPKQGKAKVPIRVSISGNPISVNAEFGEPIGPGVYYFSNEKFTQRTIDYISNLKGIGAMEGILGGTNQVSFLLSLLQRQNPNIKATFCDTNPSQIVFAALFFVGYNKILEVLDRPEVYTFSVESYIRFWEGNSLSADMIKHRAMHLLLGMDFESLIEGSKHEQRMPIEEYRLGKTTINLLNKNIFDRVNEIKEDNVYFIYLSNAYPFAAYVKEKHILAAINSSYNKTDRVAKLLKAVLENSHMLIGSKIMFQAPFYPSTVVVEKKEEYNKPVLRTTFVEGRRISEEARKKTRGAVIRPEELLF